MEREARLTIGRRHAASGSGIASMKTNPQNFAGCRGLVRRAPMDAEADLILMRAGKREDAHRVAAELRVSAAKQQSEQKQMNSQDHIDCAVIDAAFGNNGKAKPV